MTKKTGAVCFLRQITRTYQQWLEWNPVLPLGVIGYISDTVAFKFGNGVTPWNDLPTFSQTSGGSGSGAAQIIGDTVEGAIPAFDSQGNLKATDFFPEDYDLTVDKTSLKNLTGYMGTSTWGANGVHWLIPVEAGDRYRINAANNKTVQYAWLTSDSASGSVPFVSGTSLITGAQGSSTLATAPTGAKYLCINVSSTVSSVTTTFEPATIVRIGGIYYEGIERLRRDLGYSAEEHTITLTQGEAGKYVKCGTRSAASNANFAISEPFDVEACSELLIKTGYNPSDANHAALDISVIAIYEEMERTRTVQAKDGSNNPLYYAVDEDQNPTSETTTTETPYPVYTTETYTEQRYLPNNEDRWVNIPDSGHYIANIPQSCKVVVSYKPGITDMEIIVVKHGALANLASQIFGIYEHRTMGEAVVSLEARIAALESNIDKLGNATAGSIDSNEYTKKLYPLVLLGHGAPAADVRPFNIKDDLPWDGIPAFKGEFYVDVDATADGLYYAIGASAISHWIKAGPVATE